MVEDKFTGGFFTSEAFAVPVLRPVPKIEMMLPGAKLPAANDAALTTRRFCADASDAHASARLITLVFIEGPSRYVGLAQAGRMEA